MTIRVLVSLLCNMVLAYQVMAIFTNPVAYRFHQGTTFGEQLGIFRCLQWREKLFLLPYHASWPVYVSFNQENWLMVNVANFCFELHLPYQTRPRCLHGGRLPEVFCSPWSSPRALAVFQKVEVRSLRS